MSPLERILIRMQINYTIFDPKNRNRKIDPYFPIQKTVNLIPPLTPLDNITISRRCLPSLIFLKRPSNTEEFKLEKGKRRKARFYNRARTGTQLIKEFGQMKGWTWKFMTLTSSYDSGDLQRDWEVFKKRLDRYLQSDEYYGEKLKKYKKPALTDDELHMVAYIKVVEMNKKEDLKHLHILIYAPWIEEEWIRSAWYDIHSAYEVDIEFVSFANSPALEKKIGYMAKYLSKAMVGRFSYSKSFTVGLTRIGILWHAVSVFRFKYFMTATWDWVYATWFEFLCLLKAGKVGRGISSLYDFMVLSSW